MEDNQDSDLVKQEAQPREQTPGKFVLTARRALSKAWKVTREVAADTIVTEKKVPLEEITERKIAEVINQNLYNPLRERMGQEKRLPFDVTDVLSNLGYISVFPNDYQRKFPDAYRLSRIALLRLHNQGILDIAIADETNAHGEDMYYKVVDEAKLQDYLKQTGNEK